ncbi:hypothetical protein FM113_00805 [Leucobacter sp. 7(1)]|nr:hypothetical protein FM113_00805 [Leucobacter sp. 7(1)]
MTNQNRSAPPATATIPRRATALTAEKFPLSGYRRADSPTRIVSIHPMPFSLGQR